EDFVARVGGVFADEIVIAGAGAGIRSGDVRNVDAGKCISGSGDGDGGSVGGNEATGRRLAHRPASDVHIGNGEIPGAGGDCGGLAAVRNSVVVVVDVNGGVIHGRFAAVEAVVEVEVPERLTGDGRTAGGGRGADLPHPATVRACCQNVQR